MEIEVKEKLEGKNMKIIIEKGSTGIHEYCKINVEDVTTFDMELLSKFVKIATDFTETSIDQN